MGPDLSNFIKTKPGFNLLRLELGTELAHVRPTHIGLVYTNKYFYYCLVYVKYGLSNSVLVLFRIKPQVDKFGLDRVIPVYHQVVKPSHCQVWLDSSPMPILFYQREKPIHTYSFFIKNSLCVNNSHLLSGHRHKRWKL